MTVPVRVWELARELGLPNDEVTARLAELGVEVSSPLAAVPGTTAALLRAEVLVDRSPAPRPDTAPGTVRRIVGEAKPFWPRIALVGLLDLLATPLLLLSPLPLKIAVDSVLGEKPLPGFLDPVVPGWFEMSTFRLLVLAAGLQVLFVVLGQAQEVGAYVLRTATGERLTLRFRARLFRHVQRLSMTFHDVRGTADSIYRIQWDAPALQWVTLYGLISMGSAVVMLIAMAAVTASIDVQLALVAMGVVPWLFLLSRRFNNRMRPRYRDMKGTESNALEVVQEVLTAFHVVKAFGHEDREQERFVTRSEEAVRQQVRLSFAEGAFGMLVNLTTALGTAAVLFIGVRSVESGSMTLGELLMVVAYLAQLYAPLQVISKEVADLQSGLAGAERAFELLDEVPDVVESRRARPLGRARGDLELREVSFGYPAHEPVLVDVSLSVPAGTSLGVAGRTGAGKTTLVSLLPRFFDPTAGSILLDGIDLREYRLADLRSQFAVVLQEPVLFSATIAENIAYGRPAASQREIEEAAASANAHAFISTLPDGYATVVGERGMRLSGGERQRISLAHAFLKDAPVLILDEPTTAVDVGTEETIMEAMRRLMAGRTTIMIAHRLSTLHSCDVVVELRDRHLFSREDTERETPAKGPAVPRDGGSRRRTPRQRRT